MNAKTCSIPSNAPTIVPPCPEWCTWPAGHEYDGTAAYDAEKTTYTRFHEVTVGSVTVSVHERNRDGVVTLDPAEVLVDAENGLSLDKARVVAADLQAAVVRLEQIGTGR